MPMPKGVFTPNLARVSNVKPAGRPYSAGAVGIAGGEAPRGSFRNLARQPSAPKAATVGGAQ